MSELTYTKPADRATLWTAALAALASLAFVLAIYKFGFFGGLGMIAVLIVALLSIWPRAGVFLIPLAPWFPPIPSPVPGLSLDDTIPLLLFVPALVCIWTHRRAWPTPLRVVLITLGLVALAGLTSALWNFDGPKHLAAMCARGVFRPLMDALLILYVVHAVDVRAARWLIACIVIFAVVQACFGTLAGLVGWHGPYSIGSEPIPPWSFRAAFASHRSTGMFGPGAANFYGSYLAIIMPMALALILTGRRSMHRMLSWAALVLLGVGVIFSFTRASVIAAAVGMIVYVRFSKRVVSLAIVAGTLSLLALALPQVRQMFGSLNTDRLQLLAGAWQLYKLQPVFGIGMGEYSELVMRSGGIYTPIGLAGSTAHNSYMTALVELGILGGLAIVAMTIMLLRYTHRFYRECPQQGTLLFGVFAAMAVYTVANFSNNIIFIPPITACTWALFAASLAIWDQHPRATNPHAPVELSV